MAVTGQIPLLIAQLPAFNSQSLVVVGKIVSANLRLFTTNRHSFTS